MTWTSGHLVKYNKHVDMFLKRLSILAFQSSDFGALVQYALGLQSGTRVSSFDGLPCVNCR